MPSLVQGRIVRADVPDPQGRNPKNRRCVVITANDKITAGGRILIVGVTSELKQSPADHYVILQHGDRCWTGLTEPSGALCTWTIELPIQNVQITPNFLRPEYTERILATIRALVAIGQPCPMFQL